MAVSPHDIQFKSLSNGFAISFQTLRPQSRRLNGWQRSAIDALHSIVISALFTNRTAINSSFSAAMVRENLAANLRGTFH
jgi:hypothetical protein